MTFRTWSSNLGLPEETGADKFAAMPPDSELTLIKLKRIRPPNCVFKHAIIGHNTR